MEMNIDGGLLMLSEHTHLIIRHPAVWNERQEQSYEGNSHRKSTQCENYTNLLYFLS